MARYAALAAVAAGAAAANATWAPIRIGGGGLVPGMFFSELAPVAYFKTDVGGAYRRELDGDNVTWVPLLDWLPADYGIYYSVSELVLDPANATRITALLGGYLTWGNCMVAQSADQGASWEVLMWPNNWTAPACGGNEGDRASGDRMAQHPTQPGTFLIAAYDGHVYVSTDNFGTHSNASVTAIALPGVDYPSKLPIRSLTFIPYGSATGGQQQYMAVAAAPNWGMWVNPGPDYAASAAWVYVSGSNDTLGEMHRLLVDVQGPYLYFTRQGGFGRMSPAQAGGSGGGGAWSLQLDWYHAPADGYTYDGLAFNPAPGKRDKDLSFITNAVNSTTTMWRTIDGGATWWTVNWTTTSMIPWTTNAYANSYALKLNSAATISYDPFAPTLFNRTEAWVSDFFGVWRSIDYDAPIVDPSAGTVNAAVQVTFSNQEWGHEEMCMFFHSAPPNGWFFSGAADNFGWLHSAGMDAYPPSVYPTPDGAHNLGWSGAYTLGTTTTTGPDGSNVTVQDTIWVTAGDEYMIYRNDWYGFHHWIGVSHDGGQTFTETTYDTVFQDSNAIPYRVSVHPFNGSVAVISGYQGYPTVFTHDAGVTWHNSTMAGQPGSIVPSVGPYGNFWWAYPLARENNQPSTSAAAPATFYYYNGTSALFTSVDSGATWSLTYNGFPPWNVPLFAIATPPRGTAAAGDIWAFAGWQLQHSTNGGANFSQAWEFSSVKSTITVGPLPNVTGAAAMSARCALRLPEESRPRGAHVDILNSEEAARSPYPYSTAAGPAYVVYAAGSAVWGAYQGVFASVDYGNSWRELTTADEMLGDSVGVLEASLASPGVLTVGTDGRGAFYIDATAILLEELSKC